MRDRFKGPGLLGWLTIIFVVAKLCGAIAWPWWMVFIPAYVGLGLVLLGLVFFVVFAVLAELN